MTPMRPLAKLLWTVLLFTLRTHYDDRTAVLGLPVSVYQPLSDSTCSLRLLVERWMQRSAATVDTLAAV